MRRKFEGRSPSHRDNGEALNYEERATFQELKLSNDIKTVLKANDLYDIDNLANTMDVLKSMGVKTVEDIKLLTIEDLVEKRMPSDVAHMLMEEFGELRPSCDLPEREPENNQQPEEDIKDDHKDNSTWSSEELRDVMAFFKGPGWFRPETKPQSTLNLEENVIDQPITNNACTNEERIDETELLQCLNEEDAPEIAFDKAEGPVSRRMPPEKDLEYVEESGKYRK
ncbi:hypothetical protein V5799_016082 [Amblyomma americanum]|uniref:Uncharacterized protein n=1 Tax=Amblyomma americanum TaxID=6943 RepID=A0AAQ4F617_AMBAM